MDGRSSKRRAVSSNRKPLEDAPEEMLLYCLQFVIPMEMMIEEKKEDDKYRPFPQHITDIGAVLRDVQNLRLVSKKMQSRIPSVKQIISVFWPYADRSNFFYRMLTARNYFHMMHDHWKTIAQQAPFFTWGQIISYLWNIWLPLCSCTITDFKLFFTNGVENDPVPMGPSPWLGQFVYSTNDDEALLPHSISLASVRESLDEFRVTQKEWKYAGLYNYFGDDVFPYYARSETEEESDVFAVRANLGNDRDGELIVFGHRSRRHIIRGYFPSCEAKKCEKTVRFSGWFLAKAPVLGTAHPHQIWCRCELELFL